MSNISDALYQFSKLCNSISSLCNKENTPTNDNTFFTPNGGVTQVGDNSWLAPNGTYTLFSGMLSCADGALISGEIDHRLAKLIILYENMPDSYKSQYKNEPFYTPKGEVDQIGITYYAPDGNYTFYGSTISFPNGDSIMGDNVDEDLLKFIIFQNNSQI